MPLKLSLVAFGKLRTPGLRDTADYYLRNLGAWATAREVELKPLDVPDKSEATRRRIQDQEGQLLRERLSKELSTRGKFYLLEEGGKTLDTQAWAELVRSWESGGSPEVAICVGSSLGFSAELRKAAHGRLSLGPQTLSHELARVVVLEQLYRAFSVVRGHPYHNEGS